jgi:hypothetical protein
MRGSGHTVGFADGAGALGNPERGDPLDAVEDDVAGAVGNGLVGILAGVGNFEVGNLAAVQSCIPGGKTEEEAVGSRHGEEGGGRHGEEGGGEV